MQNVRISYSTPLPAKATLCPPPMHLPQASWISVQAMHAAYSMLHMHCHCQGFLLLPQGLFDAAYFNAVFGNVFDQRDELLRTALLLKPGQSTHQPCSLSVCCACTCHTSRGISFCQSTATFGLLDLLQQQMVRSEALTSLCGMHACMYHEYDLTNVLHV